MDTKRFRSLAPELRALVSLAVLFDGGEAAQFLENDAIHGDVLKQSAAELAEQKPAWRMPFCGSSLRRALHEVEERKRKNL
jgi:hypothetical protein